LLPPHTNVVRSARPAHRRRLSPTFLAPLSMNCASLLLSS
jgi:hypothetical protein